MVYSWLTQWHVFSKWSQLTTRCQLTIFLRAAPGDAKCCRRSHIGRLCWESRHEPASSCCSHAISLPTRTLTSNNATVAWGWRRSLPRLSLVVASVTLITRRRFVTTLSPSMPLQQQQQINRSLQSLHVAWPSFLPHYWLRSLANGAVINRHCNPIQHSRRDAQRTASRMKIAPGFRHSSLSSWCSFFELDSNCSSEIVENQWHADRQTDCRQIDDTSWSLCRYMHLPPIGAQTHKHITYIYVYYYLHHLASNSKFPFCFIAV